MKEKMSLILLLIILLAACSPGGAEPELVETAVPTTEPNPDAAAFAESMGISQEEANARLALQDSIGELQADLLANESDSFAGLWIEHEPAYKVVVAFAGVDGEEVIRPYLQTYPQLSDVIEIRSVLYTLAELEAAQREAFDIVAHLEPMSIAGGVDVMENRVFMTVGNPELFLQAVADAGYELPPMVAVEPIDPENIPESNAGGLDEYTGADGQAIYFPRQAPAVAGMDALLEGTLVLDDNGCLRVQHESVSLAEAPVVIWHYDFSLEIEGETITVLNGNGEPVGRVGEWSRMGGGESSAIAEPEMPEACPGPYWILGSIETMAEQAIPDIYVQPAGNAIYYFQSRPAAADDTLSGVLVVADGCFQVAGYTVIWPPDVWPDEDADPLQIVYRKDDVEAPLFTLGDEVTLPGGEKTAVDYRFFDNKVDCPGPFWGVAALLPSE
ncbi:MAG: hypothetical protein H6652_21675 [Ardenticatenaceae bacterium]|nr:hypothetical protein [Ardenticatenaceae bacterium]MCB8949941.1 hypothetical protein [Ardenticatenaceae bacterium]